MDALFHKLFWWLSTWTRFQPPYLPILATSDSFLVHLLRVRKISRCTLPASYFHYYQLTRSFQPPSLLFLATSNSFLAQRLKVRKISQWTLCSISYLHDYHQPLRRCPPSYVSFLAMSIVFLGHLLSGKYHYLRSFQPSSCQFLPHLTHPWYTRPVGSQENISMDTVFHKLFWWLSMCTRFQPSFCQIYHM